MSLIWFALFCVQLVGFPLSSSAQTQSNLDELHQWYSPARGDTFITANPSWRGSGGAEKDGYYWVGVAGSVFPAANNRGTKQPPDTTAVYSWWNPQLEDNALAIDQMGAALERAGYRRFRLEGYVHSLPVTGTLPLVASKIAARNDRLAWTPALPVAARRAGAEMVGTRRNRSRKIIPLEGGGDVTLGYVLPQGARSSVLEHDILYDSFTGGGGEEPLEGTATVVALFFEFENARFDQTREELTARIFGNGPDTVASAIQAMSNGKLSIRPGDVIGPIMTPDRNDTKIDESNFNCWNYANPDDEDGRFERLQEACAHYPKTGRKIEEFVLKTTARMIEDNIDARRYDRNNDGKLTKDEVVFVSIRANPDRALFGTDEFPAVKAGGGSARALRVDKIDGLSNRTGLSLAGVDEGAPLSLITHELLHVLASFLDVYGSSNLNFRTSIMGLSPDGPFKDDAVHPDPYHKMRVGWTKPVVQRIDNRTPPQFVPFVAPSAVDAVSKYRPLLFYGNRYNFDRLFMLEGRRQYASDAAVQENGIAVWEIGLNANSGSNAGDATVPLVIPQGQSAASGKRRCLWQGGDDRFVFHHGAGEQGETGCLINRGKGPLLKPEDGEFDVLYTPTPPSRTPPEEGTVMASPVSSGLSVQSFNGGSCTEAGKFCGQYALLRQNDEAFRPRIDGYYYNSAGNLVLTGLFGPREAFGGISRVNFRRIYSGAQPSNHSAEIGFWTPTQITIKMDPLVPGAVYHASVTNGRFGEGTSNKLEVLGISKLQ